MYITKANFLTQEHAETIRALCGTPTYVYDESRLRAAAVACLAFPQAFGLTVRYAMKAAPNAEILRLFTNMGLHIDASSGYEARRALLAGVPAGNISLSTQEFPAFFGELHEAGMLFNACSLEQLRLFGELVPGGTCGLRFNPGQGSGGTGKTNVGGPTSSFGIWHEWMPQVKEMVEHYGLKIERIHTHIGSGSDPEVWQRVSRLSLALVREFPDVRTLNLGGGYKVGRMPEEPSTDLQLCGAPVRALFEAFAAETGRQLHLEIEPGTFLLANAGALLCTVGDIVSTGPNGYRFIKVDSGMTELLRPSLYAAQHPITILPKDAATRAMADEKTEAAAVADYIVVGHCCESGDLLTPAPGNPEALAPRTLTKASIGDFCVIDGAGAYCSAMSTKNYNSFPEAPEVLLTSEGEIRLIRKRQTLEQMLANEVS